MSKFREQMKLEKQENKAPNKTMGPAKVEVPSPEKYLQKHSKEARSLESIPIINSKSSCSLFWLLHTLFINNYL